jgi:hypothetical protein
MDQVRYSAAYQFGQVMGFRMMEGELPASLAAGLSVV